MLDILRMLKLLWSLVYKAGHFRERQKGSGEPSEPVGSAHEFVTVAQINISEIKIHILESRASQRARQLKYRSLCQ